MKELIIVGAGGFGREVYRWAKDIEKVSNSWRVIGFLDDNPSALEGYQNYPPIIGSPLKYLPAENQVFVCAIGDTKAKLKVCRSLEKVDANFTTLIHPSATLGGNIKIGDGSILCPRVVITTDVFVGKYVILNVGASVGHDSTIADGCTINAHADINGFVNLKEGVFVGSHGSILPNTVVGDFATIGAGSVAINRVKPGTTIFGVPAIKIK